MTALQFEAEWEQVHADLEEVGLAKTALEKFLAYIVKVGPPINETIRMDRRPRTDKAGGMTTRTPETWEECHEVLCEIEGVKAGTKAFSAARSAGQAVFQGQGSANQSGGQFGGGKARGKDKGKDKGKPAKRKGKDGKPLVCFEMRDHGTCSRGDGCGFSHSPKDTGRQPVGPQKPAKKPPRKRKGQQDGYQKDGYQKDGYLKPPAQGAGDQSGAGKGDKGKKGKAKGKGKDDGKKAGKGSQKDKLCKHIRDPQQFGPCPHGGQACNFSHNLKKFKGLGKGDKNKGKYTRGGAQQDAVDEGWDTPTGIQPNFGGPQRVLRNLRYCIDPSAPYDIVLSETAAGRVKSSTGRQRVEGRATTVEKECSADQRQACLTPQKSTSYSGAGVSVVLQGSEKVNPEKRVKLCHKFSGLHSWNGWNIRSIKCWPARPGNFIWPRRRTLDRPCRPTRK